MNAFYLCPTCGATKKIVDQPGKSGVFPLDVPLRVAWM